MKFPKPQTLKEIAALLDRRFVGAENFIITGVNEIHRVENGDVVFVDHPKYYDKALNSAASVIIINTEVVCPEGKALIISEDPFKDFNQLTRHFATERDAQQLVSGAYASGVDCQIHPSVIVGKFVEFGDRCVIHPGVVIYDHVKIGNDCIIHANAVIGSDAFYYKSRVSGREKMLSFGSVVIGNDVEIGASCTIDKGVTADTIIGDGTKMDNHVHIGHDTRIGINCLFAAQVGIAGCVVIEDNVILWGQVGVASDVVIGQGAVVLGQSGITKDLEGGKTYFGTPAEETRHKYKELALIRKLPEVVEKLGV